MSIETPPFESERERDIYLAAWIDAEGCIVFQHYERAYGARGAEWQLFASIANTDADAMDVLQRISGGTLRHGRAAHAHWKDKWELHWGPNLCRELLPRLRPYLVIKGRQADLAIEALAILRTHRSNAAVNSPATWARLGEIQRAIKQLNAKGKPGEVAPVAVPPASVRLRGEGARTWWLGASHPNARFTIDQVREMRRRVAAGASIRSVALAFNGAYTTVYDIIKERSYREDHPDAAL